MNAFVANACQVLRITLRAAVISLLLAAPVLALPGADWVSENIIEAPPLKKSGAGLVLLVSLQRG